MTNIGQKFFNGARGSISRYPRKAAAFLAFCLFAPPLPLSAQVNGAPALLALGQPSLTQGFPNSITASGLNLPRAAAVDPVSGRLYVVDANNNRVLWWLSASFITAQAADGVIGQADMAGARANRGGAAAANTLSAPNGVAVDAAGNVWVADSGNNRVLRYAAPAANGPAADLVLGQSNFFTFGLAATAATLNFPTAVAVDAAGSVWVADSLNNRVLKYINPSVSGAGAALVLGQPNFTANAASLSQSGLNYPAAVAAAAGGSVWVADFGSHRVLKYNAPGANGPAAALVLGQPDYNSALPNRGAAAAQNTLNMPAGVAVDAAGNAWVADTGNNRVLKFIIPSLNGVGSDLQLGQAGFTADLANRGAAIAADNSLAGAMGIAANAAGDIWVTDSLNNRVLRYAAASAAGAAAGLVLGQKDFLHSAVNTPAAQSLYGPAATALESVSGRLYAADYDNNRVLWWNTASAFTSGRPADGVLGQPDFTSVLPNQGGLAAAATMNGPASVAVSGGALWVSDLNNSRILRFPASPASGSAADLVLGQPTFATTAPGLTISAVAGVTAMAFDAAGNLWAADSPNNRALRFDTPFADGKAAALVLGQADFTSGAANRGGIAAANTLSWPSGVSADAAGNVWVADSSNNRALRYPAPVVTGMPADLVFGQVNFAATGAGATQTALNNPAGVLAEAAGAVWVTDSFNSRVLRFDLPFVNNKAAGLVLGQADFTGTLTNRGAASPAANTLASPNSIFAAASGLWVADTANNRLLQHDLSPTTALFPVLTSVSSSSIAASWTSAGAGSYMVLLSSNSDFGTLTASSAPAGTTASFGSLVPNTSYYLAVKVSTEVDGAYALNTLTAFTGPHATPLSPVLTTVSSSSVSGSWTAYAGANYVVALSSFSNFSVIASSATQAAASSVFIGLNPGTSYYLEVKLSTETDAAFPFNTAVGMTAPAYATALSPIVSGLTSSAFNVTWTAVPGASYVVVRAADSGYTSILATATQGGNSIAYSGLAEYSDHYFQVKLSTESDAAYQPNRLAVRTLAVNTPLGPAFTQAGATALTAVWASVPGATFNVVLSSAADYSAVTSSAAQAGNSAYFTGLTPDTSYYLQVKLSTEPAAAYAISRAVRKTAAAGAGSSLFINANNSGTISVTWPYVAGEQRVLLLATDPAFTNVISSFTTAPSEYNESYEGLAGLTTYYFAMKLAGEPDTSFAFNTAAVYTPGTQLYPYISTVSTGGFTVNWEAAAGVNYTLLLSTDSGFTALVSSTTQAASSKAFTGFPPDTLYYYAVKNAAEGDAAFADLANSGWQRTLPTPLLPALTVLSSTSLSAAWDGTSGGVFVVVLSSASDFTGIVSTTSQAENSSLFTGLAPYTTYYLEVKRSSETDAAFSANLAAARTLPDGILLAPALTAVSSNTLTASWTAVAGSTYVVILASDPGYTVIMSSTQETEATVGYTGLTPDTSYYFAVKLLTDADYAFVINTAVKRTLPTKVAIALTPATPGRLNASWTQVPGAYYVTVLALDNGFTNVVSSVTTESVIGSFTGLIGAMPYYLGVKLVTETDGAFQVNWSSAVAPAGALRLFALSPGKLLKGDDVVPVTLTGEGMPPESTVKLMRTGYADVPLSTMTWVTPGKLIIGVPRWLDVGQWTVVVTGGGFSTALPGALVMMTAAPNSAKIFQGIFKPNQGESANLATSLTASGNVSIKVYDGVGRSVRVLANGFRAAGDYLDLWDGRNGAGGMCASGVYLIRFECPGFSTTKRVVLVK